MFFFTAHGVGSVNLLGGLTGGNRFGDVPLKTKNVAINWKYDFLQAQAMYANTFANSSLTRWFSS